MAELKSLNGLKGDLIKVGQVLKLPAKYCQQLVLKNEQSLTLELQKLIRYFELDRNNTSKTLLPKTDDINKTVRNK